MHDFHASDLALPGAVEALLAQHRAVFGDTQMVADGDGEDGGDGGSGGGEVRTDSPKPTPPPREDTDGERPGDKLGDGGKKALEQERRNARVEKSRADKAVQELEELRRQQMTEQERVAAERDDWKSKYEQQSATLAARELAILRVEVAQEKGLTVKQARRLQGTTRDELEADADEFKADLPDVTKPSPYPPNTPKPDPSQGPSGGSGAEMSSVAEAAAAYRARKTKRAST